MIEVECPCGETFEVDDDEIDGDLRCPACHQALTGRTPEDEEVDDEDADEFDPTYEDKSLIHEIGPAFRYPLEGQGPYALLAGWVVGFGFLLLCRYSFLGFLGVALVVSYLLTFLDAVILEAAGGGDRFPDWPDAGEFVSNLLEPFWRLALVATASGAPFLVTCSVLTLADVSLIGDPPIAFLIASLALLWIFLLPITHLSGVLLGPLWAFNYAHVLRSIGNTLGNYLFCFLVALFLIAVSAAGEILAIPIPFLGPALSSLFGLYLWVVFSRLLGMYYYTSRRRLKWLRS